MNTFLKPGETIISASQVSSIFGQFACQNKYYWEKIQKVPRKPNTAFDIGKAIENAVTNYHVLGNMDPLIFEKTIEQLKTGTYADRFGTPKYGYKDLTQEEQKEYDESIAETDHIALLSEYANVVKPMKPIKSQLEIRFEIAPGVILLMYLDYLFDIGIMELKTAGRSWSEADVRKKIQHIIQVWGYQEQYGPRVGGQYHVLVKNKKPKIDIIPIEVTDIEIEQVKNLLINAVNTKKAFCVVPHERDKTNCMICGADHSKEFFFDKI